MVKGFIDNARVLKKVLTSFVGDNCFRYSAALSFYALFSIAPAVMISIQLLSPLAEDINFQQEITAQFSQLVGPQGAEGITVLMENLEDEQGGRFRIIVGSLVLMFSATNIFVQLQNAFNDIFSVRVAVGKSLINQVLNRLISLGVILSLGFILLVSLVIDSVIVSMQSYLTAMLPDLAVFLVSLIQFLLLAGLAGLEIYALLHYLPDVSIPRRFKLQGTAIITVLLLLGKTAISWYIGNSRFSELGGASASVIVLMLWIYYSSLIVFFGAEYIKVSGTASGFKFHPRRYAVRVATVTVQDEESGAQFTLQPGDGSGRVPRRPS